jgi:hypothetical protein
MFNLLRRRATIPARVVHHTEDSVTAVGLALIVISVILGLNVEYQSKAQTLATILLITGAALMTSGLILWLWRVMP